MSESTDFIPINLEDKHMRILKGYSKQERKELEEAKDNGFLSAMTLIYGIGNDVALFKRKGDCHCHALSEKYCREDTNDNNQMAKDIVDFYCGNAKFPEQKYYIQLIKNNDLSYIHRNKLNHFLILDDILDGRSTSQNYQNEFTEQEIKDIDPRYMSFIVPAEVED